MNETPPKQPLEGLNETIDSSGLKISLDESAQPKKRGRPKGSTYPKKDKAENIEAATMPIEAIESLSKVPFSIVARLRKCPTWELTDKESKDLAKGLKPLVDILLPQMDKYYPYVLAVTTLGSVIFVKIKQEEEFIKEIRVQKSVPDESIKDAPV